MNTRRTRDTERTREQILEAARQLFVDEGYEAVSVRKIAERAKITHGTIYVHFKDKDDLLYQVSEEQFSRLLNRMRRLPRSREPVRRLRESLLEAIRFGIEHPNDYQLMMGLQTTYGGPKSTNQWGPNSERVEQFLSSLIKEAIAAGELSSTEPVLDLAVLLAMVHGLVLISSEGTLSESEIGAIPERAVDVVLRGLGAGS